ncbi:disintegrin and metalloproteinase domain-containing protein 11 [Geospiza fortis]|uniref:Disintegrin and metalloproteinase domain-containing protein 11 n=1 Tax=Geospiza fortis TaxID=48883 RepID=A0A8N5EY72_GEOFO|nr:disintegrin and metalloproteinase domain-containing protein 11 [Geospiza fortis]
MASSCEPVSHPPQAQAASRKRQLCSRPSSQVAKRPRLELGSGLSPLGEQMELVGGPASQAGALPRRLPRAAWQEGRVLSQITHPSRLVGQSSGGEVPKHHLDTRVRHEPGGGGGGGPGLHLAQVSFMVRAFGSAFTLDLRLNHHLLASHYVERHVGAGRNGTPQAGAERGQGLRPHIVQRIPSCPRLGCLFPALSQSVPGGIPKLRRRRQVRRAQHTVHSETKYIELAVVNDHKLFLQLRNSVVLTSNFAKSVVNLADMIYKEQLNTRIVLVAMETWAAEDRIRMGRDSLEILNEFVKYRPEGLAEHSDTVHLFSGECARSGGNCCKKCTLTHDAMCSNGLCCKGCKYEPRGVSCREAVNECDIPETCTGDSSQCPPNLHKLDGYFCENEQGTDVLCGFLLCANISGSPRLGELSGEIATTTFCHQNRYVDCRGGHVQLVDGSDLSYVEDGTPCGPGMLCLDRKCLPATAFNFSSCPGSWDGKICFDHGVCSNEGKCICRAEWTGKDCSVYDPIPEPKPTGETERYKGPSGTNIIIGSIAGAVLVAAIVLGGTGWGFK